MAPPFVKVGAVPPQWEFFLREAFLIRDREHGDGLFELNEWFYLALLCTLYTDFAAQRQKWDALPPDRRVKKFIKMVRRAISDSTPDRLPDQNQKNHFAALLWDHLEAQRVLHGGSQGGTAGGPRTCSTY